VLLAPSCYNSISRKYTNIIRQAVFQYTANTNRILCNINTSYLLYCKCVISLLSLSEFLMISLVLTMTTLYYMWNYIRAIIEKLFLLRRCYSDDTMRGVQKVLQLDVYYTKINSIIYTSVRSWFLTYWFGVVVAYMKWFPKGYGESMVGRTNVRNLFSGHKQFGRKMPQMHWTLQWLYRTRSQHIWQ